jgi:hypothetical protein
MDESGDPHTNPPNQLPFNREAGPAYEAIRHHALERYIFDLIKGWAETHDSLYRKHFGRDFRVTIREVTIDGKYPDTQIRLRRYEVARDQEDWYSHALWKDPTFFDPESGQPLMAPEQVAGDILMLARGG